MTVGSVVGASEGAALGSAVSSVGAAEGDIDNGAGVGGLVGGTSSSSSACVAASFMSPHSNAMARARAALRANDGIVSAMVAGSTSHFRACCSEAIVLCLAGASFRLALNCAAIENTRCFSVKMLFTQINHKTRRRMSHEDSA